MLQSKIPKKKSLIQAQASKLIEIRDKYNSYFDAVNEDGKNPLEEKMDFTMEEASFDEIRTQIRLLLDKEDEKVVKAILWNLWNTLAKKHSQDSLKTFITFREQLETVIEQ